MYRELALQAEKLRHLARMEHEFWRTRWDNGQTAFHEGAVNPVLLRHFARIRAAGDRADSQEDQAARVLVPLCGKSLDLSWFEQQGCDVLGIEFVEQAIDEYFSEKGESPKQSTIDEHPVREAGRVRLVQGDFFAVAPKTFGHVDVIYDRAALVAIAPDRRAEYVARLAQWLKPTGRLLLVSFEHDMGSGPPFSVPEVEQLLAAHFSYELVEEADLLDDEPRFKDRGATTFLQRVFSAKVKDR